MSIISKLPKKVNEWLVTGQKLGLLTEKQKNDFIAKYISLISVLKVRESWPYSHYQMGVLGYSKQGCFDGIWYIGIQPL